MEYSGDRVDAVLTREQIQAVVDQKMDNITLWLNKAYDFRPPDPAVEKALLEGMAGLQHLRRRLTELLSDGPRTPQGPNATNPRRGGMNKVAL